MTQFQIGQRVITRNGRAGRVLASGPAPMIDFDDGKTYRVPVDALSIVRLDRAERQAAFKKAIPAHTKIDLPD